MLVKKTLENVKITNEFINIDSSNNYPIFVTYYTVDNGYQEFFKKLKKSLIIFNLNYYAFEILRENKSWETICQKKPNFLLYVMDLYPTRNIVWIDSDAIIEKKPDLFLKINKELGMYFMPYKKTKLLCSGTFFLKNSIFNRKLLNEWINDIKLTLKNYKLKKKEIME